MQSTADKVLEALQVHGLKGDRGGRYRCTKGSPIRAGSDGNSFVLTIDDGEHGAYIDHKTGEAGSLYELAHALGIETPEAGRVEVGTSKTNYASVQEYAERHYVTWDVLQAAGFEETTYGEHPAIKIKTGGGNRFRLLDVEKNAYRYESGGKPCWYGLNRAITTAYQRSLPIVLCNGEVSTVVAQHYGIPACCVTGGEKALSDEHLAELLERWKGSVVIALDCDETGRKATNAIVEQLEAANVAVVPIDLGLSDGGDLADFCGLHERKSVEAIQRLSNREVRQAEVVFDEFIEFVSSKALLEDFMDFIEDKHEKFGRVIEQPFQSMHDMGGFAEIMTTKKVWLNANVSGGGKTMWSEALADAYNKSGYNVIYIGDEWSEMEMTARTVQRHDPAEKPITYMDYLRYTNGRYRFSDQQKMRLAKAVRQIRGYEGETFHTRVSKDKEKRVVFLEDIMEHLVRYHKKLLAAGNRIDVVILDYVSLYDTRERGTNNLEEYKVGLFKSYCKSLDVLGISTVQVNKAAENRVKYQGGMLNHHDLYSVRADKGNLITTMNRVYLPNAFYTGEWEAPDARKPYLGFDGEPVATPNFIMKTAKNSVGSSDAYAIFHFDYTHLAVREGVHPDYRWDNRLNAIVPKAHISIHDIESTKQQEREILRNEPVVPEPLV